MYRVHHAQDRRTSFLNDRRTNFSETEAPHRRPHDRLLVDGAAHQRNLNLSHFQPHNSLMDLPRFFATVFASISLPMPSNTARTMFIEFLDPTHFEITSV